MPEQVPFSFRAAPLPINFKGTPQQFADALVARLMAWSESAIATFVAGSVEPSSNVGPWLKNGQSWYVWDVNTGSYVPQVLDPDSLGYAIQSTAPDQNQVRIWIETDDASDPAGKPVAVKTYYNGAWTDVYADELGSYLTIDAFNTAIANYATTSQLNNAISGLATFPAMGTLSAPQSIPATGVKQIVVIGSAPINPAPGPLSTANNRYVCPAAGIYMASATTQIENATATASTVEAQLGLLKNGGDTGLGDTDGTPSPNGGRWSPGFSGLVQCAQGDYLQLSLGVGDSVGTGAVNLVNFRFSISRVSS